jgi:hypothetical protein
MTSIFCWWCSHPLKTISSADPKPCVITIHDGQKVRVHKSCEPYAVEWVRQSRLTAIDPEYHRLTQRDQLARVEMALSDPRLGKKKGPDAKSR